jgi:DNA invertase Pin-like site-specific DNA recombinase
MEFVDNGYSGVNFERPAVQELLELVRQSGIDCIVVKDFSRFGRNSIETGYFIEMVFPIFRTRFISISDGFDSNDHKEDTGGMQVAFKFLMHYSQDLSKKVKSAKHMKMRRGENIVANAIYGYRKNDAGAWGSDDEAAAVVRKIYNLALEGLPPAEIRNRLFEAGFPTPGEYQALKRNKDITPKCLWATRNITHILTNEQYIGTYIAGKERRDIVGSRKVIRPDKSEWIMMPDSHPPIISKELFARVQGLLTEKTTSGFVKQLWEKSGGSQQKDIADGKKLCRTPLYGYRNTQDGGLEIDANAAEVVERIYSMALEGFTTADICDRLSSAGFPTPTEYIKLSKGRNITPQYNWTVKGVRDILRKIQYTGAYVSGKTQKDPITGKERYHSKEEWVIVPDSYPAIISKETFEKVRVLSRSRKFLCCNPRCFGLCLK